VDVEELTGAQLKKVLTDQTKANPKLGVLIPSASLRYTVDKGVLTELTLHGKPVADTQVVRIAASYILAGGGYGFPRWEGKRTVWHSGPDDMGALASYLANHSPVHAPKGDRATVIR
jgi:2',3'-cyclic-nucleotide 2'-phosphodiesterase (5'-nucleotidase family)